MSASVNSALVNPDSKHGSNEAIGQAQPARAAVHSNYKGFVAGVFSGISKLSGKYAWLSQGGASTNPRKVGHPFDTIKVRLQTSEKSQFRGPVHCLAQTIRNEGPRGLYKGATPPCQSPSIASSMHPREPIKLRKPISSIKGAWTSACENVR